MEKSIAHYVAEEGVDSPLFVAQYNLLISISHVDLKITSEGILAGRDDQLLNALRAVWLDGHRQFGWPPLGVDQGAPEIPRFGRKREEETE